MIFGTSHLLKQLPPNLSINISGSTVYQSVSVRNLGVTLDAELNMQAHVANTCRLSMISVRHVGKIRRFIDNKTTEMLMNCLVTSRIDYCNSLLCGISSASVAKLQRIQNLCARIITRSPWDTSTSTMLRNLHWLPVSERIRYKALLLAFKALNSGPEYLSELVALYVPRRSLRSEDLRLCTVPSTHLKTVGDRAFAKYAPHHWNELPIQLRMAENQSVFKKLLKTLLFNQV